MATYISYTPTTVISKAMFNFDAFGWPNYKLDGTVRVSVSDTFSFADYLNPSYSLFYSGLYTSRSNEVVWTTQMTNNIKDVIGIYSQFANIAFEWKGDYDTNPPGSDSTPNPEDVGRANLSDININWIYRSDVGFAGISGANSDSLIFDYTGGAGDIFLNQYAAKFAGDYTLDLNTRARQTLMHELGHSLGLSHPHSAYNISTGVATITADYSATKDIGFSQLGFRTSSVADMYKEYFTIMSYDDQQSFLPGSNTLFHAHTPMILDVIALQQAYGEGQGTTGSGNDTIAAGTAGYRTYFDKGGIDTIDLSAYTDGAYLQMGVNITGAAHMVGVAMSQYDATNTIVFAGDPAHLRWFYGEYENAIGSSNIDVIFGNSLDNVIGGQGSDDSIYGVDGNDTLNGGAGNDQLYGGAGNDLVVMGGIVSQYQFSQNSGNIVVTSHEGMDTLTSVEYIRFGSSTYTTDVPLSDATTSSPVHLAKQITDLYVAYFNRGPDAEGFDYWFHEIYTAAKSLRGIAEDFAWSNEYQSMYPSTLTNRQFVEQIYQNLFDRKPDQGGWDYWSGRLDTGSVHRSGFILDVIEGAYAPTSGPEDRTLIDNKHDASLYYTGQLAIHPQEGYDFAIVDLLNLVNGDVETVAAAERVIDYAFNDPVTLTGVMTNPDLFDSLWMNA
jgi:Ca2+-binding RTX toxin-like protein